MQRRGGAAMKLIAAGIVLGDDEEGLFISEFRETPTIVKQEVEPIRSAITVIINRGLLKTVFSWTTTRLHEDFGAVELFLADHRKQVPYQGLFTWITTPGATEGTRHFANAFIEMGNLRRQGCTSMVDYTITAGASAITAT